MGFELLTLQLIAISLVVLVNIAAESALWQKRMLPGLRRLLMAGREEPKQAVAAAWYWRSPVETGVLEVALAITGVAIALPIFAGPPAAAPRILVWANETILLLAATLAAMCSLWLLRIYIKQLIIAPGPELGPKPGKAGKGNAFSVREAGPYSFLAYALVLLLIGLALLPIILAF
jgi:hypothetical protein